MIPLRDSTRSHNTPLVTLVLIGTNLFIYFLQSTSSDAALNDIIINYALFPGLLTKSFLQFSWSGLLHTSLVTSIFLHGSWFHVLGNMLYLWIFGDNIEDKMGHSRFLFFYLLCGVAANLAHVLITPNSMIPLVGASGAIAGVLGAYFITFPHARITSLIFIFIFITVREIPAVFFLFFWFFMQLVNGISTPTAGGGVAWWAHAGGFIAGIAFLPFFKKKTKSKMPY